ncbi:sigma-70 family RNA polymerase sigma factor [Massilia glaciei]|uniref:Uncharacterized protein n=1 Tax=Massilia glaciei TaxID=1524097 RepID=A0A2U2HNF5_9BURK|nr:hypothetical protein [Massilia glaciei]PWF49054.1 hypothetical protein C7C56_008605 [Massilia glaciei]
MSHVSATSDWHTAEQYVKRWQAIQDEEAREEARQLAAVHVHGAMLRDAMGIVFNRSDKHRCDRIDLANTMVLSVMSKQPFTLMIKSHDPNMVGGASLRTWLTRRLIWKLYDYMRTDGARFLRELDTDFDPEVFESDAQGPEEQCASDQMVDRVWAAIDSELTIKEKNVIILHMKGFNNSDGAAIMEISLASYKRFKQSGLLKLEQALTPKPVREPAAPINPGSPGVA